MKILIIDDRSEKAGFIKRIIRESGLIPDDDIHIELDLTGARSKIRESLYDLIILDLHMPESLGEVPQSEHGIAFIDEIYGTASFNIPLDIVALTALSDAKEKFSSDNRLAGFTLLQYDEGRKDWQDYIISKIRYSKICNQQRKIEKRLAECDIFWLTAVDVETDALKDTFDWRPYHVPRDSAQYYLSDYELNGRMVHIIRTQLTDMGMTPAASITTKAILQFSPKLIIMTGIAAGLDSEMKIGDVMIATRTWNYDCGKYSEVDVAGQKVVKLKPDGKTENLSEENMGMLQAFREHTTDLKPYLGTFACGNAVVASALKISEDIKAHSRKTIGIDMESYGVMLAAMNTCIPPVTTFIIKGISDKGDTEKNDEYQKFAATNSTKVAKNLIDYWYSEGRR